MQSSERRDDVIRGSILSPPIFSTGTPIRIEVVPDGRAFVAEEIRQGTRRAAFVTGFVFSERGEPILRVMWQWERLHWWQLWHLILRPVYHIKMETGQFLGEIRPGRHWWQHPELWVHGERLPAEWRDTGQCASVVGQDYVIARGQGYAADFSVSRRELLFPVMGYALYIWRGWSFGGS